MEEAYEVSCCVVNKKVHLRNSIYKKFKLNREYLCPTKSFHCIRLLIPSTYQIVNKLRIINTENNRKTNTNLSNQMLNHLPFYCSHLIIYSERRQKIIFGVLDDMVHLNHPWVWSYMHVRGLCTWLASIYITTHIAN